MKTQPSALTLGDDAQALYRRVLRHMPAPLREHAAALGWSRPVAARRLAELEQLRLVRVSDGGVLRADDPRASLGRLLDGEEAMLDQQRRMLLELRHSIESYEVDYRRGLQLSGPRVPPWEQVGPAEIPQVVESLARSSRGPILQVTRVDVEPEHIDEVRRLREELLAGGREHRSIFQLSVLTNPLWLAFAEERAATGERQRYLEELPIQFAVFGRSGVLLDEGGHDADYLLIRPPALIDVFVAFFEELWRRAEPVHEEGTDTQDLKLLELLALGFKDEAIARHLGLGLRTVRRRISTLMAEHGSDTRFQLGLAVSRRGLLDAAPIA